MHLERNLNPPLRMLYVAVGVLFLAYGVYAHALLPGIALLALIICGVLSIVAGAYGH